MRGIMNELMIKAVDLGKLYHIGLRPTLGNIALGGAKRLLKDPKMIFSRSLFEVDGRDSFWALKDVSFEVYKGERFGILGRNGAGKSTLLKLISGLTQPTEGYAEMFGEPTLLASVGAGMSAEMTGRENIYINGAVLGAEKSEIDEKFDEIVTFAELERFIDMPVKFYSNGMFSRLGFSVCVHLVRSVVLLDEVLMAGDEAFRIKSIEKIKSIAVDEGRTVILVSHAMKMHKDICQRCLLLVHGEVAALGNTDEVLEQYQRIIKGAQPESPCGQTMGSERSTVPVKNSIGTHGEQPNGIDNSPRDSEESSTANEKHAVSINRVSITGEDGNLSSEFVPSQRIQILIEYELSTTLFSSRLKLAVKTANGIIAFTSNDTDVDPDIGRIRPAGSYISKVIIPQRWLSPGEYFVTVIIYSDQLRKIYDQSDTAGFQIGNDGRIHSYVDDKIGSGVFEPVLKWDTVWEK